MPARSRAGTPQTRQAWTQVPCVDGSDISVDLAARHFLPVYRRMPTTASVAMMPVAPLRFSMTNDCPSRSDTAIVLNISPAKWGRPPVPADDVRRTAGTGCQTQQGATVARSHIRFNTTGRTCRDGKLSGASSSHGATAPPLHETMSALDFLKWHRATVQRLLRGNDVVWVAINPQRHITGSELSSAFGA